MTNRVIACLAIAAKLGACRWGVGPTQHCQWPHITKPLPCQSAQGVYWGEVVADFVPQPPGAGQHPHALNPDDIAQRFWQMHQTRGPRTFDFGRSHAAGDLYGLLLTRDRASRVGRSRGPVWMDWVVNSQELVMLPAIQLQQAKGFSLFMLKAILNG